MSKFRFRQNALGEWIGTEEPELDIFESIEAFAFIFVVFFVLISVVGSIIIISSNIQAKKDQKAAIREQAVIEAQMAISASIWDLDVKESNAIYGSKSKFDFYGNEYNGVWREFCAYTNHDSYSVIDISKNEYDRLTGTIFTRPDQAEDLNITFKIYADNKCIYDSGNMNTSSKAISFDLNIRGANKIKFLATSADQNGYCNPGIILFNAQVHAN